jgi:hypothetical protein
MQATISLKVSQDLVLKLKKASKVRGITMSDLIRTNLEDAFDKKSQSDKNKEPEIFKYFGIFDEDDEQINEFERNLEKRKARYKMRKVEL